MYKNVEFIIWKDKIIAAIILFAKTFVFIGKEIKV